MSKEIYKVFRPKTKQEWLANRHIGGSDASSILHCNPWQSKLELWEKLYYQRTKPEAQDEEDNTNELMELGTKYEPLIRAEFSLMHPELVIKNPPSHNWIFLRKDKEYMSASVDGLATNQETKERAIIEIKFHKVRSNGDANEWESGNIPQNYYIQCLHYLLVTGYDLVYFVPKLVFYKYPENTFKYSKLLEFKIYRKDVKEDLKILEQAEEDFYNLNILKGEIPEVKLFTN